MGLTETEEIPVTNRPAKGKALLVERKVMIPLEQADDRIESHGETWEYQGTADGIAIYTLIRGRTEMGEAPNS